MKKDPLPISSRILVDHLVSYGRRVPEATEELAPHVVIRRIRNALHMTQVQLAMRAGLPQSHLAKIETGKVDVRLSTLNRILRAMYCEAVMVPKFLKSPRIALAEQVRAVARRKVERIAGSMALEKQFPQAKMIRALIRSEEKRLMDQPFAEIWDDSSVPDGASLVRGRPATRSARMPVRIIEKEDDRDDLRFWLAQPPAARINAMELLRRQMALVKGERSLPRITRSIQLRDLHS